MSVFHALARLGVEALCIVSPDTPLVSIGYFQNAGAEVDLEYCREKRLPFMRREVGGGTTYLDRNQVFYQVIWRKDRKDLPSKIGDVYRALSEPVVSTYRELGIETRFRPINDIVTEEGRKISGEGGGDIGDFMVFVGGILVDFDYYTMSRILKVPEEKFKDKIWKTIEENVTTVKKELGSVVPRQDIVSILQEKFGAVLGPLEPAVMTDELAGMMSAVERTFTSEEFLNLRRPKIPGSVKIREGVEIRYGAHKAPGGLIRAVEEVVEERLETVGISGDFTLYPKAKLEALEQGVAGSRLSPGEINERIEKFYELEKAETPGVAPEDLTKAIMEAQ
jgi:lipoate-protein ligase A